MSDEIDPKSYLGSGWAFSGQAYRGRLRYVRHEEDIEQAIQIILLTTQGERGMLPEFGGGLRSFIFEPNSSATHRALEAAVRRALVDWEPRIDVERVEVVPDADEPNLLAIQIDYVVRSTNTAYNRVFPFYLLEGGA